MDVPADVQLEVARIAAQASIQAAKIAARAARTSALITATGTLVALIGTVIAAYVAYINVRAPLRRAEEETEAQKSVLLSQLHTTVVATLTSMDRILDTYRRFDGPVKVQVLPKPATLVSHDPKEFTPLGPAINEAIILADLRLDDYRRAKAPIEDRLRQNDPGDDTPVVLQPKRPYAGCIFPSLSPTVQSLRISCPSQFARRGNYRLNRCSGQ